MTSTHNLEKASSTPVDPRGKVFAMTPGQVKTLRLAMGSASPVIKRVWAMPNSQTFDIPPIAELLDRWATPVSVDPFARDSDRATFTNDLNPATAAQAHLPADQFCIWLAEQGVEANTVLFDPPYSPRQIAECYRMAGLVVTTTDTQNARLYKRVRDGLDALLVPGGVGISMGWNTVGLVASAATVSRRS